MAKEKCKIVYRLLPPPAAQVKAAREHLQTSMGMKKITDAQDWCAAQLHTSRRAWQQWETNARRMHPAFWELFRLKTGITTTKEKS